MIVIIVWYIEFSGKQNISQKARGIFQKCLRHTLKNVTNCLFAAWPDPFLSPKGVACKTSPMCRVSLITRPHPLTRKKVWWLLSTFLVVPSQQSWFLNKWMLYLYDVALFDWLVQKTKKVLQWGGNWQRGKISVRVWLCKTTGDHWIPIWSMLTKWESTKFPLFVWESGSVRLGHQTLFLMRGWSLDTKLQGCT